MKDRSTLLAVVIILLLSAVSGTVFWKYTKVVDQNRELREEISVAKSELDKVRAVMESSNMKHFPPGPDWERIKTSQRPDPKTWLTESILSRDDLIPWEGVLGGTMRIYDPSSVWFLGPNWCLAWAEDGHIGGYMLLRFETGTEDKEPFWRLIDSEMPR
ncbi:MAG TPA: hypothetical protein P5541_05550 [Thermovirgaceae bacterium]|nr:hypothetical protein [Thermovirgaceae bacterium]